MTADEFKEILRKGSNKAKEEAVSNVTPELEIFNILIELLKDSKYCNRFFAIYHLIDKFSKFLENTNEVVINTIYESLFDDFPPVVDRTIWALSIIGDKALAKLIKEYYSSTESNKIKIILAIGRGNFTQRTKDRIQVLLDGIKSKNDNLRFHAMGEIISNTQSTFGDKQQSIDLESIHIKVLPVAKEFTESEDDYIKDVSTQYINWVEKNYNRIYNNANLDLN
ncbi:conserved protein of unknown function [Tenacibaculum sp. 190524A02b]|uniref:hypothetical protein n=1 Tax=Tenacibaculum vairaonense TaxID=3137860 RepID=UPI0032B260FE